MVEGVEGEWDGWLIKREGSSQREKEILGSRYRRL
jgi:hypothetical protein